MTSPPDDVYEAAIDYLSRHIDIDPDSNRWLLDDRDVRGLAAALGAAGVAAGRAQAAADIRAADVERIENLHGDTVRLGLTVAARIAEGGEPRG